ncbi:hypothetical protein [Halomonas dongshanensis]
MSLLWLSYYAVSLVVLVAVYLALGIFPRLLRLVLTWVIAGAMWAPARFQLPLLEDGEFYTGWAPAAMVAAVSTFEHDHSALLGGLLWLIVFMGVGAVVGIALWWRKRTPELDDEDDTPQPRRPRAPRQEPSVARREPVIR